MSNLTKNLHKMLIKFAILVALNRIAFCARHIIDGKYHTGIRDFFLLIPRRIQSSGDFQTYHVNQYFDHDFVPTRIGKRSLDDPELIHYGIWLENNFHQLDLWPNREFLSPNLLFERRDDTPVHKTDLTNLLGKKMCYYTGKVRGVEDSTAAMSTCDGLLGHIRIKDTDYFIEPVDGHGPNDAGQHLHVIYDLTKKLLRKRRSPARSPWCAVQDKEWESGIEERIRSSLRKSRKPRGDEKLLTLKPKYMEALIVCDKSLIEFHKGHRDLDVYILTAANTAFNAFRDASFGSELTLSLVRVIYLEKDEPEIDLNISVSIEDTLKSFNKFAERVNFPEENPLHHDVAMLGSRVDMCSGPKLDNCVVCGIAKIGGACTSNSSANVAEDDGIFELAMTMTHEAGHLLGITHDGADGLGKPCIEPNKTNNSTDRSTVWIMSVVDTNAAYMGWSECSRAMSASFIKNGWADCMNDEPERANKKFSHIPIGALYSRDEQCFLSTARKGKEFEANRTCGDPTECENLYCEYNGNDRGCKTLNHAVADGTPCGEDKWCWKSTCVPKGQRPDAIDGEWSEWTGWSECSRTCGGGIQINRRSCNNPQQASGGRYCEGDDEKIKLCNLEPCELSFRDKVCKKKCNGVALFIHENQCQIPCLNSKGHVVWSNQTVPNGEACAWGKRPKRRCILGDCVNVGCDDEIESSAVLDECGICNGDGDSCTIVNGRWKQKKKGGPRTQLVTKIPMGAFNIKIREASISKSKISILSSDSRTIYVNDYEGKNHTATLEGPVQLKDEVFAYYSVSGSMENFTVEGPLREHLLLKVVYLCPEADFKWQYSFVFGNESGTSEERTYRWEQDGWTECSRACNGGIQTSTFSCIEDKLGKVSDNLCLGLIDKPEVDTKACMEQPCKTKWRTGNWGQCHPCSKTNGMKARGVECMEENPERTGDDILVEDDKCEDPKPNAFELCASKETSTELRKKRCNLGLPDRYMDVIWSQLNAPTN